jgi:predicted ribosome quality control (RQC) complex YloA/Tae2 family protein
MSSKGRPYRTVACAGFLIFVGRGAAENDELTFDVAEPHDFWLHVAGVPGSHVVIRNPDRLDEVPPEVLARAAELAVWHSRARERSGKINVHACRVSDVSKPRGFDPGEVRLREWTTLRVYSRDPGASSEEEA